MVSTRRRSISAVYIADESSSSSLEVAPPKKLKVSTRRTSRTKSVTNKSPSTSQLDNKRPSGGTSTTPDSSWLPHGWTAVNWTAVNWSTSTEHKYTVFKETATHKKFYSKQQVLNYLAIARTTNSNNRQVKVAPPQKKQASTISTTPPSETPKWLRHLQNGGTFTIPVPSTSGDKRKVKLEPPEKKQVSTISTTPSEIPKRLYDLIQNAAKARKSLKLNSNNRFAQRKLDYYEPKISRVAKYCQYFEDLPSDWKYDPETSFMAHVPKPPPPPKPKTKKKKKKKIKITWSSPNYHGSYPWNNHEQKVWNEFTTSDTTEAYDCECFPIKNLVMVQKDEGIVNLLGKFAVDTFNKSCHMYVNKDEDNMVGRVVIMECKFLKLTKKYIFYMTIEAIEQGIHGVYETRVECKTKNGARTLMNFILTDRKPKWNRGRDKTQLESEVVYETVEDGSSDPQDFYKLTGLVHRETEGGGFDYHNPPFSAHLIIYNSSKDEKANAFSPNVSQPL